MIDLVIDPRDPELEPLGVAVDGSRVRSYTATIRPSRTVRLAAGGFLSAVIPAPKSATTDEPVSFTVPATDGSEIHVDDRSTFTYTVDLELSGNSGRGRGGSQRVSFTGMLPTALGATVQVTALVNAEPSPVPVETVEQIVGDLAAIKAAPSWATATAKSFDPTFGLYNFNARTLSRFRQAKGRAVAGLEQLHVSVIGDSTSHLADYATPQAASTWSAHMRDTLTRTLGLTKGGTGVIPVWDEAFIDNTSSTPAWEPRLTYHRNIGAGALTHLTGYGVFGHNAVRIVSDGDEGEVSFTPGEYANEIWVYLLGSGHRARVTVWDGTGGTQFEIGAYAGETFTPTSGFTAITPEPGYVRHSTPASNGGLVVARLPVARQNNWTAYIRSASTSAEVYLAGVESRDTTTAKGLRVSNLAEGGRSLNDLVGATNETSGYGGLPFAFDTMQADLAVIGLGLNDWQGHRSVSIFKSQLKTTVARQRQAGATGTYGFGTGAAGDVVLWLSAQPDYGNHPPDHVQTPALTDFYRAVYEVADEDDVALIDHAYRWTDYATSAALMRDFIHPNRAGHADQGAALGAALAAI